MKRIASSIAIALMLCATGSLAATAQDYPGDGSASIVSAEFTPGGSGSLSLSGLTPNTEYSATIRSTPIPVSGMSDANGALTFTFDVPSDFELNAEHTLTFANGEVLTFCVGGSGSMVSCSSVVPAAVGDTGSLADTGARHIDEGLKAGLAAIVLGTFLLLWRRRQVSA